MSPPTAGNGTPVRVPSSRPVVQLAPFVLILFLAYAAIGLPLAVIPIFVSDILGYGPLVVGFVVALQAAATLLTRAHAGRLCDSRGGKISALAGTACCAASGIAYLLAFSTGHAALALALLVLGRLLAGFGESFVITGGLAWSIAKVGDTHAGKAMVWTGMGTYGAIAAGAPLGLALQASMGFPAAAIAIIVAPGIAGLVAALLPAVSAVAGVRLPFRRVVALIWRPGACLALTTIGFGAISAFIALDFAVQGWTGAGIAVSAYGVAYILVRLVCGGFPDRFGSARVAAGSMAVELVGLVILWAATGPATAYLGTFLTGAGLSLLFPCFGTDAVRRVPATNRGSALGAYVMFFDVGMAVAGPLTGLVAGRFGYPAAFGAGAAATAMALAVHLARRPAFWRSTGRAG